MIGFNKKGGGGGATTAAQVSYFNGELVNVQEALDSLLYQAPKINAFTNNVNTVEKGTVITSVLLNWDFNKTMVSASINNGIGSVLGQNSFVHAAQEITSNKTYTLTANDGTNSVSRNSNIVFQNKRYWGISANSDLAGFDIMSLQNSELSDSKVQTRVISGGGQYMYFAFPESFGVPTFTVNGLVNNAFTSLNKPFKNTKGHIENYIIVRTNTVQFGELTIQVK